MGDFGWVGDRLSPQAAQPSNGLEVCLGRPGAPCEPGATWFAATPHPSVSFQAWFQKINGALGFSWGPYVAHHES